MTIGYGYAGVWANGTIGWHVPKFIHSGTKRHPDLPDALEPNDPQHANLARMNQRLFYCQVIIRPILDKLNRPITKIVK